MPYPALIMPQGPEQLLLQLLVVFVAAKVVGEVFESLRLPSVVGEILAGIALGPYALGWVRFGDAVNSFAELGVIFVLFRAGLETSPKDLLHIGRKALQVTAAGMTVPFLLGFGYMKLSGSSWAEAVFVAAAMVATSVGITAANVPNMTRVVTFTTRPLSRSL
jgi:Kef-type K+ transport system membrane component KefB